MSNILKLQKLIPQHNLVDNCNMFGSAISTICPPEGLGGGITSFEME